jgi:NADPH2:quinone reductase
MKAMQVKSFGGPEVLELVSVADVSPGAGEIAVEVKASACNFFDVLICKGRYQQRPPLPFAPGAEVAGVVVAIGEGVTRAKVGDRVLALLPWGGYASRISVVEKRVFRIPDAMGFDEAAAFGIVCQTSYFGLVERAALRSGETLLVHAAAGGVGLAAVQIGRALGANVIGTAGGADKCAIAREHGAAHTIDYRAEDLVARVKDLTGGRGADVIYDPVGGDVFDQSMKCIAFEGRLVVVGFASGRIPELAMNRVLLKNVAVTGLHWGLYVDLDPARVDRVMDALFTLWSRGQIRPLVSATFPLEDAKQALDALASRGTVGKVVLHP